MVERCGNQIDGEGAKRVGKTIVKVNEKIIKTHIPHFKTLRIIF